MTLSLYLALAALQTPPVQVQTPLPQKPQSITLPPNANPQINGPLTLSQARSLTLQNSPLLQNARAAAQAAQGRATAAKSALFPQISATGSYLEEEEWGTTASGSTNRQNTDNPFAAGLALEQLLFDFNRTQNQVRQQQSLAAAAEARVVAQVNEVLRDVELAYADLRFARQIVQLRQDDVATRQSQLDLAQSRLVDGLGSPGDVVRARTSLAAAITDLVGAESAYQAARSLLALRIGLDPATTYELPAVEALATTPGGDLAETVKTALANRPELTEIRLRVRAADQALNAAKQGSSPALSAVIDVNGQGRSNPADQGSTTFGVRLSWPLFDSGRTRGLVQEADALRTQTQTELTQAELEVAQQVVQAWLDLQSARDQLTVAQAGLANAQEAVRIAQGRYADDIGTFLEVTDAQAALVQARQAVLTAQTDQQKAQANLTWAIGQTAESTASD